MIIKNKVIRSLCLFAVGTLLVGVSDRAPLWIIQGIGIMLGLSGLISLLSLFRKDVGRREMALYPVLGIATLTLAVFLIGWPASVVGLLLYTLAGLLIAVGGIQGISLFRMQRMGISLNPATYLIPILTIGVGIFVALNPMESAAAPFIILGAGYILYACLELWSAFELHLWQKEQAKLVETTAVEAGMDTEAEAIECIDEDCAQAEGSGINTNDDTDIDKSE